MKNRQSFVIQVGMLALALAAPLAYAASQDEQPAQNGASAEQSKPEEMKGEQQGDEKPGIGQAFSDATATASIKTRLALSPDTDANNIHVTTTEGKVSLEGDVASAEEKAKAAEIARNTNGVTEVQNKLNVASKPASGKEQGKENQG